MNYTEDYAITLAEKVLKDIGYWGEDYEEPTVRFDAGEYIVIGKDTWLVSFPYAAEDYGRDVDGHSNALRHVTIFDSDGIATSISYRNGHVELGYNIEEDIYFIADRRP
ncbi:hypothetical protein [Dokdonia sp.]|uniref:hypothetical protein n=1 Tax=Dokdonia sp. TaxID=2024995 RepID=UPI003265573C